MTIGTLERVPLRDVWPREDRDFTRWLQENIEVLGEVLGLSLTGAEREQSAGNFNVDIVAEDKSGETVVIENQLGKSDHDHLGKLLTYLAMMEAKTAIWLVANPRPEHVRAISWLNDSSSADFYLVKIEAIRIGDSAPAPLLTQITGPSEEGKVAGKTKKKLAERQHIRNRFWTSLLERSKGRTELFTTITPGRLNWIQTGAGMAGLSWVYFARQHDCQAELYIDWDKDTGKGNKDIFDQLHSQKEATEAAFGASLEWRRLDDRRASRIIALVDTGGYEDEEKWPDIQDNLIGAMIRLEKALGPHIGTLDLG